MKKNGLTLIEVLIAIALIGIIAVAFLPFMTFSYTNLIYTEKFTQDMFNDQAIVENEIDELRFKDPEAPNDETFNFFGVDVKVHSISVSTSSSGQVNVFLPKQSLVPTIPVIESPPVIKVRNNSNVDLSPQPVEIDLLEDDKHLFVDEVVITSETRNDHLMNVYRWYASDELSEDTSAPTSTSEYVIIHEWNEARSIVNFNTALANNFIPNFKEYTDPVTNTVVPYNRLNLKAIKNHTILDEEAMINRYGNRHIIYGVTPYSLAGRMGQEELSNSIYVRGPRLEIESAEFDQVENKVLITFNQEISDEINESFFNINEEIGNPLSFTRNEANHKELIILFENEINKESPVEDNFIGRGGVKSKDYGAISIWYGDEPNSSFTIE